MKGKVLLVLLGFAITLFFGFLFTPVTDTGDSPSYIGYALKINGELIPDNFSNRSPLYSFILAGFIKAFGTNYFPRAIIIFQFILIWLSSIILYKILFRGSNNPVYALLGAIFFFLSLATIYYGYQLKSESVTVFLFILSLYFFVKYLDRYSRIILFSGLFFSFLILARYSTLPLLVSFLLLIIVVEKVKSGFNLRPLMLKLIYFLIAPLLMFNIVSYHNLVHYNFYKLFPNGGSNVISRNAILATLNGTESVTAINQPILGIFIDARDKILEQKKRVNKKGSLLIVDKMGITDKLYVGFSIYKTAKTDLCRYFMIDPANSEFLLSSKLSSFYKEIIRQNYSQIMLMRFYSFLNSFRSSSGITTIEHCTNLNALPGGLIVIYKVTFLSVSFFTFFYSCAFVIFTCLRKIQINRIVLTLIVLCYSFYLLNFIYGTVSDANRFKFSSDPLMIALFVFFVGNSIIFFKKKKNGRIFNNKKTLNLDI